MNPYKLKDVFKYLTSNNQLLKKKLKLGTSEIPIPPKRQDVIDIEVINRFSKANPRVDTTNLKPLSVKHSDVKKPDEPDMKADGGRAGYEDGGMLVQPSDDGSRPGYGGNPSTDIKLLNTAAKKYGYKDFASVPTNTADRSNILRDAKRRESGAAEGKGRPGVKKEYKTISPMKDPEVVKKQMETRKKEYLKTPEGERLQWIADNSKDYDTPDKLKAAYEKHFKHKVGSKADALFNIEKKPGTRGGVGSATGKKINFGLIDGLQNFNTSERGNLMFIKKGFSEDELFKGAILQNNPKVQTQFKNLFEDIHKNVSLYSELGPEGIVERLKSKGGNLLNDFDFIKAYSSGGQQTYGGVHRGITRNSLLNLGVPEKHLTSYQTVRKPLQSLEQILVDLKNRGASERYGISNSTAFKISSQLESFLKGQGNLRKDIAAIDKQLGDVKFKQIFGGVNFEHTLAKRFGKDYKYLPRNYLLKGQFTTAAFNQMKKNAFDLPLINLMKKHEQGKVSGAQVQKFIDDFNAKTNNYADFSFDTKKGKLGYTDTKVSYDLSRYDNPNVARQELIDNIKLTQSDTFQKGMSKTLPESRDQLKLFKSKEAKTVMKKLMAFCPAGTAKVTKAGGGRVPYADGPVCTPEEAARGINEEIDKIKKGNASAGEKSRTLNKLKNLGSVGMRGLVKAGLVSEVLFEAALGFDKVVSEGQSPMQAFRQSYLTAPLRGIGVMKSFEEGEREEILKTARDKGKVSRVLDLQNLVGDKNKLANRIENLKSNLSKVKSIDGNTFMAEKNIADAQAELQDMRRSGELTGAEQLFSTKPQDLNIKDQFLMNAYNNAIEKRKNIAAEKGSIAQSVAADRNRLRDRMNAEGILTTQDAKNEMQNIGNYYGQGFTPYGINKLYEDAGMQNPGFGIEKVGPRTGKYNEKKGLQEYLDSMRMQQIADAGGVANMASGGIASLTKTIPPESGPTPQGLPYVYNNVKKI